MGRSGGRLPGDWMWTYAARLLEDVERLQRRFFEPMGPSTRAPSWRAPVDVYEHDGELTVVVALPGVPADRVQAVVEDGSLVVRGERQVPLREGCVLHRLEIPHGKFERRLALPPGGFALSRQFVADGCLHLVLLRGAP